MKTLEIPPGVVATPTFASYSTQWRDANLIRWVGKRMRPVGGWKQVAYGTPVASRIKKIHTWLDNANIKYTAFLCEANIYVDVAGTLFDITPVDGLEAPSDDVTAGGYGNFTYSSGTYGTPRPEREVSRPIGPVYSADNWGELLVVMTSVDGRLLFWDPGDVAVAAQVPNSPTGRCFVVTPERMIIVFGANGIPQRYAWCSSEDFEEWTIGTTTTAGFLSVEPAAIIVAAKMTNDGAVFFTPVSSYLISYSGPPFYYGHTKMVDAVTPISPGSVAAARSDAMWPSESGFWEYAAGSVQPIPCPVWEEVQKDIHPIYSRFEAFGVNISTKGEYWWFYPDNASRYNNKFVMYNYIEGWWSKGKLSRSAGISSAYDTYPLLADNTTIYSHENGMKYVGAPELPWVESHVLNVYSGAFKGTLHQMLPDVEGDFEILRFLLKFRQERAHSPILVSPAKSIRSNGYVDFRCGGRDFQLRVEATDDESEWTMGQHQYDLKQRGSR